MYHLLLGFATFIVSSFAWCYAPIHNLAAAELRVVTYNTTTDVRLGLDVVLEAIGDEVVGGISRPIDVLAVQEQSSAATDTADIVGILNGIYGPGTYDYAMLNGGTSGAGRPGLVFNTTTIELLDQTSFGTVSTSTQARQTLRYLLRPIGYDDGSVDFYLYNNHYKASTGSANQNRRLIEAQLLRDDLDILGDGVHAILAGDFNIRTSSEPMYQELLSPGDGQAFDPIDTPGSWNANGNFKLVHSQSPLSGQSGGLIGGGVDDRFDFQLVTGELLNGVGFDYIPGSYHVFGNNGTHVCCNSGISTGSGASASILAALESASDHLPVVADYQLPDLPPAIAGDFNGNGIVDVADYGIWRNTLGSSTDLRADSNGNNVIDQEDYVAWQMDFGNTAGSGSLAQRVPEPCSMALMVISGLSLLASRSRFR